MTDAQSYSGQTNQPVFPPEQDQIPLQDTPPEFAPPANSDVDTQSLPPEANETQQNTQPPIDERQPEEEQFEYPLPTGPQPEQLVLEWTAPSRPFKKRNRQYYTTVAVIVFLICLILFFAGQFLPIAVVIAVAFLAYVLSAVPPEMVLNRITTYGVRSEGNLFYWDELGRFWFSSKYGQRLVHFETSRFPNQLTLVVADQDEEELQEVVGSVLLNEQPPLTSFEKAAQWLQEKIPLDTEA